ncbi:T9SS type A sorting domain-containing protein [Winogradskyella schleiferi]|uniref:T9SS type A sorting domain-containing protein n=1 Tax=Winogradskyella schleiferi TaxID=2686078 RepID=UPI0015C1325F|nr:T9SS type A sorting domain-containing protein [Winogradskyella schleiferi]
MKLSFFACLMLFFSFSFAQLSVRNDAFVFVNDEVLFVNDDVNLEEADSKIYLRDESQLIQGTGTTGNSGVGELSVYQNSEVNQFAYHYWCSPVGGVLSNTLTNNAFQINQVDDPLLSTLDPIDSNDAIFTSAYDGSSSPLTISTRWLWMFVTSDEYSEWIPATNPGNPNIDVTTGLGFTMKGMGPNGGTIIQNYDFRGKPNNGTITNSIAAEQFTLIGNPYPSALDAADFLWDPQNTNLDEVNAPPAGTTGAIYYWEQDVTNSNSHYLDTYVGGYASYTCTEPDGSDNIVESFVPATMIFYLSDGSPAATPPNGTGGRVARRYIPVGQGFMVEGAESIAPGSLVYVKNSHRDYVKETAANSQFFRSANVSTSDTDATNQYDENGNFIVPDDYKRFRMIVSFNELYSRELLANFHDSASEGFDYGLEAKRPSEVESDAYWIQNNDAYVIQAHSFDVNLKIPLVLEVEEQQPISFGIYDIQNFDTNQNIYIHDIETDIYVNLNSQNYHINLDAGNYTDRFEIVFTTESTLSIDELDITSLTILQDNGKHQLTVQNPNSLDIKSVEIFDVAGKQILKGNYNAIEEQYNLSTLNLSDGVYVVNVSMYSNTKAKSKKIIVKN